MFCRIGAAVAAAAIAAMLLAPAQLNARGGAGIGAHGGFRPPVRPIHPPVRPLVRRHDPLFVHHKFRERHAFEHRHDRRNIVGSGGYGYGGYGGSGYGDNGYGDNGYGDDGYGDNDYRDYRYCSYGFRYSFTCRDYSAFYGRYYDPSDTPGSIWVPPNTVRPTSVMPIAGRLDSSATRGGCRSETVAVPSRGESQNSVTITRC